MMKDSKMPKAPSAAVDRYFADRKLEPLKGELSLYRQAIEKALEWPEKSPAELQYLVFEIIPEAVRFTLWDRLRKSRGDRAREQAREYMLVLKRDLTAVVRGTYGPSELRRIAGLGSGPSEVVRRYHRLLTRSRELA
jgi:hypothetical protein